jgi:hypothetical protein
MLVNKRAEQKGDCRVTSKMKAKVKGDKEQEQGRNGEAWE